MHLKHCYKRLLLFIANAAAQFSLTILFPGRQNVSPRKTRAVYLCADTALRKPTTGIARCCADHLAFAHVADHDGDRLERHVHLGFQRGKMAAESRKWLFFARRVCCCCESSPTERTAAVVTEEVTGVQSRPLRGKAMQRERRDYR
jgi:hypothetical protein